MSFKFRTLSVAIATLTTASLAQAAGLDRSTQPSWGFTQDGTFAYVEHVTIDPTIEGKDASGNKVNDMAEDYHFLNFGAKADVNDTVSVGAFFDQPWGADVQYSGNNNFVGTPTAVINGIYAQVSAALKASNPNTPTITNANELQGLINTINAGQAQLPTLQGQLAQVNAGLSQPNLPAAMQTQLTAQKAQLEAGIATINKGVASLPTLKNAQAVTSNLAKVYGATNVEVSSENFTGLVGVKFGANKNFQVYGGPAIQKLEGEVHLRGNAYKTASGYDLNIPSSTGYGWMAGVAYSKPEIALKAALTYRSEIDHDIAFGETLPALGVDGVVNKVSVTTPESYNVDFQTGVNPTTLLTAKVRYVPWSDFAIRPKVYNAAAKRTTGKDLNLVSYDEDSWTAELGLGKKLSDKWAVSGSVGWDSGAGNPVTSLGPVEGNWNVGLGAKYNITPEWSVSGGAKYLKFGDATAKVPDGTNVGEFTNNDGMVYGVRLAYQKK